MKKNQIFTKSIRDLTKKQQWIYNNHSNKEKIQVIDDWISLYNANKIISVYISFIAAMTIMLVWL